MRSDAVVDLSSIGVCTSCIWRFLGSHDSTCSNGLLTGDPSSNKKSVGTLPMLEHPSNGTEDPCIVCLGILQTLDTARLDNLGGKKTTEAAIVQAVKDAGHQFDTFSLEVTVPCVEFVREHALWLYLQEKYGLESWLHGKHANDYIIPLKEAVKSSLVKPLQMLLGAKFSNGSSFIINLVYKHTAVAAELDFLGCNAPPGRKRKQNEPRESLSAVQRFLASMSIETFRAQYVWPPSKNSEFCQLNVSCYRTSVYSGGRYLKFSRNISQSPWLIDDERKGDGSVQEIIADVIVPKLKADSYKFHAAGREDIDVRMLGTGRPFMLELVNARILPSNEQMRMLGDEINTLKEKWVKVRNLQLVGEEAWNLMLEGESDKQKQYSAMIWLSGVITDDDLKHISEMKALEIQQKTPIRVLHRRSPLVRPRIIYWMQCERIQDTEHYFFLHICTQAGTYIKEFVHGDFGRTYPNVGSLFGCEAEILLLDVTHIQMDLFH